MQTFSIYLFQLGFDFQSFLVVSFVPNFAAVSHHFEDRVVSGLASFMLILSPHGLQLKCGLELYF